MAYIQEWREYIVEIYFSAMRSSNCSIKPAFLQRENIAYYAIVKQTNLNSVDIFVIDNMNSSYRSENFMCI